MTTAKLQSMREIARWTARLWSVPLIAGTFLLAGGGFFMAVSFGPAITGSRVVGSLSSPWAMAFAVAFVIAWRWERAGGWIALGLAVGLKVWGAIRWGYLGVNVWDLLFWPPVVLFAVAAFLDRATVMTQTQEPDVDISQTPQRKSRRFFALPCTDLGWWSLLLGAGFFVFMRLFWMQAMAPGRNRSTFFSDPINAGCLIGAFGAATVAVVLALVAIIWKRERSVLLVPLLLLGVIALFWALAAISGANA